VAADSQPDAVDKHLAGQIDPASEKPTPVEPSESPENVFGAAGRRH
jgi:hypothetical protein